MCRVPCPQGWVCPALLFQPFVVSFWPAAWWWCTGPQQWNRLLHLFLVLWLISCGRVAKSTPCQQPGPKSVWSVDASASCQTECAFSQPSCPYNSMNMFRKKVESGYATMLMQGFCQGFEHPSLGSSLLFGPCCQSSCCSCRSLPQRQAAKHWEILWTSGENKKTLQSAEHLCCSFSRVLHGRSNT